MSVTEETIYPVASYGDAMTPFYSALAIWVGGVILTAILKVEAEPKGLRNVTEGQKYWGKFILFFVLGQIQTAVIVLGDIYLLGCQCQEPVMFWVASAITSFAFTAVIYSLALAFGDIGKAIVIVIVVMQVAGSSGSLPDRDPAGYIQQDLSLLPLPVRHKRNARGDMRHVSMGLLDLSRRAYDIRRRRHTHRPCAEKAVYKAQPLRRARSGEIGGAVIWRRNSMSASAKNSTDVLYGKLLMYAEQVHQGNKRRIRHGLVSLIVIPIVLMVVLLLTESSRIVFLLIWIACMFVVAAFFAVRRLFRLDAANHDKRTIAR